MNYLLFTIDFEPDYPPMGNTFLGIEETSKILGLLASWSIRATFFVTAQLAQKFPDVIQTIQNAGHEIGCHGWRHEALSKNGVLGITAIPRAMVKPTITQATDILTAICGSSPKSFRAPYYSYSHKILPLLVMLGYVVDSSRLANPYLSNSVLPYAPFTLQGDQRYFLEVPVHSGTTNEGINYSGLCSYSLRLAGLEAVQSATLKLIRKQENEHSVSVFSCHPWEFVANPPWKDTQNIFIWKDSDKLYQRLNDYLKFMSANFHPISLTMCQFQQNWKFSSYPESL